MLLICLASATLLCCDQKEKGSGSVSESNLSGCYLHVQGRDSIRLSLQPENGRITGTLAFRFYEKDKSAGTIEGAMHGDTLFANYHFMSEGMESDREIAMLRKENSFIMGVGEILNTGNKDVFRDRRAIEFDRGVELKRITCR